MSRLLRIAVAEDDKDTREMYRELLKGLGHDVVGVAANGKDLVTLCSKLSPDLVIADIKMPDMDGIAAADIICKTEPIAFILVSGYYDEKLIERAQLSHVLAYLVKPVTIAELKTTITLAMSRFEELQALQKEAATLRQALHDRKIIERAKGLLMQHADISEQEAFKRLQKLAWDKNEKLVRIAETVILASEASRGIVRSDDPAEYKRRPDKQKSPTGAKRQRR
jgi:two-component system, response regulator PdtaR